MWTPPAVWSEAAGREAVRERSFGRCEGCPCHRGESFQHRVKKGQGGLWSPSNGIRLCGSGTTGCHGDVEHNPEIAYLLGLGCKSTDDASAVPAYLHTPYGTGWWLLNHDGSITYVDIEQLTLEQLDAAVWWDRTRRHAA